MKALIYDTTNQDMQVVPNRDASPPATGGILKQSTLDKVSQPHGCTLTRLSVEDICKAFQVPANLLTTGAPSSYELARMDEQRFVKYLRHCGLGADEWEGS